MSNIIPLLKSVDGSSVFFLERKLCVWHNARHEKLAWFTNTPRHALIWIDGIIPAFQCSTRRSLSRY